jgi:RNA polymerase sigma factor, sigma-70 family
MNMEIKPLLLFLLACAGVVANATLRLDPSTASQTEAIMQKVRDTLMELPDKYRVILSLFLFEGYDYQEIAQITGQKEVTVRSQYMRGRERLAELLKGKLGND